MYDLQNIYKNGIDFSALASEDTDFAKFLKSNGQLDFSDPDAIRQLTQSLLRRDFGLKLVLPSDRLCPPVPNRLNYILWIHGLLDTTQNFYEDIHNPKQSVLGLDIGTGASCIYPLLGCTMRSNWQFYASDLDEKSLQFARKNVALNELQDRILPLRVEAQDHLIPIGKMESKRLDFTMCNPPFYESKTDMLISAEAKKRPPCTACTGSESEMVTPGGEVAFVFRMIDESLILQSHVQWYTSMLGKFSSVSIIHEKLKESGIDNFAITEFVQGNKTRRWGIAWSFSALRPSMAIARGLSSTKKALLPFPSEYQFALVSDISDVSHLINQALSNLPLRWQWKAESNFGIGFSEKDVWSRAARRHHKIQDANSEQKTGKNNFGFKVHAEKALHGIPSTNVTVRWLLGNNSALFESFCGMLKRSITP